MTSDKLCWHCGSWVVLSLTSKPGAPQNSLRSNRSISYRRVMGSLKNSYLPPQNSSHSHLFFEFSPVCDMCLVDLDQKEDLLHILSVQRSYRTTECYFGLSHAT